MKHKIERKMKEFNKKQDSPTLSSSYYEVCDGDVSSKPIGKFIQDILGSKAKKKNITDFLIFIHKEDLEIIEKFNGLMEEYDDCELDRSIQEKHLINHKEKKGFPFSLPKDEKYLYSFFEE
jgi:hypothetical protein